MTLDLIKIEQPPDDIAETLESVEEVLFEFNKSEDVQLSEGEQLNEEWWQSSDCNDNTGRFIP